MNDRSENTESIGKLVDWLHSEDEDSFAPPTGRRMRKHSNVEDLALVCEIAEKEFKHEMLHDEYEAGSSGNCYSFALDYFYLLLLLRNSKVNNFSTTLMTSFDKIITFEFLKAKN